MCGASGIGSGLGGAGRFRSANASSLASGGERTLRQNAALVTRFKLGKFTQ